MSDSVSDHMSENAEHHSHEPQDREIFRPTIAQMTKREFYDRSSWFEDMNEGLFKIKTRGSSFRGECFYGMVHFIASFYCLAIIPQIMAKAGYNANATFLSTALFSGLGCLACGIFANLPFVCAPATVVAIFLSVFLRNTYAGDSSTSTPSYAPTMMPTFQSGQPTMLPLSPSNAAPTSTHISRDQIGSAAVIITGLAMIPFGWRPLGNFFGRLVPNSIQVGTAIGIGILTALAGAVDVGMVQQGNFGQLVKLGSLGPQPIITFAGVILICILTHYRIGGSFCVAIVVCSLAFWIQADGFPKAIASFPQAKYFVGFPNDTSQVAILVLDLLFLCLLYLNGLCTSLTHMAHLTEKRGEHIDDAIPRGRWIFLLCGIMTVLSGLMSGMPVLISPESGSAIKEGAKTGLSSVVCGIMYLISIFFGPLFTNIPSAGTSPILIMIGILLFQNSSRMDWKVTAVASPAYIVLFFIPFSYSVIQGVLIGYVVYLTVGIFTGVLFDNFLFMLRIYWPSLVPIFESIEWVKWSYWLGKGPENDEKELEYVGSDKDAYGFIGHIEEDDETTKDDRSNLPITRGRSHTMGDSRVTLSSPTQPASGSAGRDIEASVIPLSHHKSRRRAMSDSCDPDTVTPPMNDAFMRVSPFHRVVPVAPASVETPHRVITLAPVSEENTPQAAVEEKDGNVDEHAGSYQPPKLS